MSNSNNPNASGTGTTYPTGHGPKPPQPPSGDNPQQPSPNEADFITRQQEEAGAAIANVVADMKRALADTANLRQWAQSYPWVVTGGAVVAGIVAGMVMTPSKEETAKEFFEKKWDAMKDRFAPVAAESPAAQAAATSGQPQQKSASAMGIILREVFKAVGPTLGGLITGAVAGQQAQDTAEKATAGNGHHAAGGYSYGGSESTMPPPT